MFHFCFVPAQSQVTEVTNLKPFVLFLLVIVLSVLLRFMDSDYHFGISKLFLVWVPVAQSLFFCVMFCRSFCSFVFSPLYCLSIDLRILITPLVSLPLHCLSCDLWFLITHLVSSNFSCITKSQNYDYYFYAI